MGITKRIFQFIDYKSISKREFYIACNLSNGFLDKVSNIGSDKIEKILSAYPEVSPEWLVTGNGGMLRSNSKQSIEVIGEGLLENATQQKKGVIRYYDVDASASPIEMFSSGSGIEYKDLIIPGFEDCEIALNIWGDSMEPKLCKGEMIICKLWQESFIEYGFVYLIETKTGHRMIKYVQSGQSESTISCISENKFYQPFEVKKSDILKLYVVKGHLERSML